MCKQCYVQNSARCSSKAVASSLQLVKWSPASAVRPMLLPGGGTNKLQALLVLGQLQHCTQGWWYLACNTWWYPSFVNYTKTNSLLGDQHTLGFYCTKNQTYLDKASWNSCNQVYLNLRFSNMGSGKTENWNWTSWIYFSLLLNWMPMPGIAMHWIQYKICQSNMIRWSENDGAN